MDIFDLLSAALGPNSGGAVGVSAQGTLADAGGQIIGGASHYEYGQQAAAAAQFQAAQLRQNAGQAMAVGQHQAEDVQRQTQLVTSRALAVAGASGGGASDPGVVTLMANIAKEGSYRQAVALYGGDERARAMNTAADAKDFEAKNSALNADEVAGSGFFTAATTLMKGEAKGSSLFLKYGMGMPQTTG